jgi:Ca2+/Na+ antiporter
LGVFGILSRHALHRVPHEEHIILIDRKVLTTNTISSTTQIRVIGEALLALLIALGAVIIMVQSAQGAAQDIHLSPVILGLIILAIATSLPNTVVVFSLARTGRATACVEEVLSSNSINVALGIALPLLIWHPILQDRLLLLLDAPLMVMLTLVGLLCILRQRVSHSVALGLLLVYVAWVIVHMLL